MYIIKIRGKVNIPDYAQLRDEKFTLVSYFRVDRPEKALEKAGFKDETERIKQILNQIPFGKIQKLEL